MAEKISVHFYTVPGTWPAWKFLKFGSLRWHSLHTDNTIQQDLIVQNCVFIGTFYRFLKKDFVQIGLGAFAFYFIVIWDSFLGNVTVYMYLCFGFKFWVLKMFFIGLCFVLYNTYFFKTLLWRPPSSSSNTILWRPLGGRPICLALNPALILYKKGSQCWIRSLQ